MDSFINRIIWTLVFLTLLSPGCGSKNQSAAPNPKAPSTQAETKDQPAEKTEQKIEDVAGYSIVTRIDDSHQELILDGNSAYILFSKLNDKSVVKKISAGTIAKQGKGILCSADRDTSLDADQKTEPVMRSTAKCWLIIDTSGASQAPQMPSEL